MRFLVLGSGVSGRAAARLLRRRGLEAAVYDERPEAMGEMREEAFETHNGVWQPELLQGVSAVIASPGFAQHSEPIASALVAGLPVWSELELGYRYTTTPVIAVTGTNGKTTTTRLACDMAVASGIRATTAGNIGTAICDVADGEHELIVAEASSFQLRFIDTFAPRAAGILNVAPDHLDWHGTFAAYAAAKARIYENMEANALLVFDEDDPGAAGIARAAPVSVRPVSGSRRAGGGGVTDGILWVENDPIEVGDVDPIFGVDLAVAAALASAMGATPEGITKAAADFVPGPHRRTIVAERGGVTWVDDSKATNPHAAAASAGTFGSVVLIAGGRNKGLDLTSVANAPNVRHVIAIGEAAPDIVAAATVSSETAGSIEEAVARAAAVARPGDTVLLAPGCASFDQFPSYAARGDAFAEAVRARSD